MHMMEWNVNNMLEPGRAGPTIDIESVLHERKKN